MIMDKLSNWKLYAEIKPLKRVFEFLKKGEFAGLKAGRHEIYGDKMYFSVNLYKTKSAKGKYFEAHKKYIDVQYIVKGSEIIKWSPVGKLKTVKKYDRKNDFALYKDTDGSSILKLLPGMFAVFFPEDGHMPGCTLYKPADVFKIVVKVKV